MPATGLPEDFAARLVRDGPDAVIYADAQGRIRYWNAAATRIFGHGEAAALGQSLDLIIPERLRPRHWHGYDEVIKGRRVNPDVDAMVVPGSQQVKAQAEAEGLDEVFRAAGFDWRSAGCSMCLGMNPDVAAPGERVASTSNRNFEGRQGRGARSHLVSPQMAAAAAIEGHFVDIRSWS